MSQIHLSNISKSFKGSFIFKNVDLCGEAGQIIAITGKSGVGKSTLLNIIAGLETPTSGSYQLDGINMVNKDTNELARIRGKKIGYISQFSPMIPILTAYENICIPLLLSKQNHEVKDYRMRRIKELSKLFEVQDLLHKKVNKLSGGEVQRVGIIRSLVNEPAIIVADEPTGSLDEETSLNILNYFHALKSEGIIIILATHSSMVSEHSDIVYNLTRDGLILEK